MRTFRRALLAATVVATAASSAAHAQNTWTGFFLGLNAGYGFNDVTGDDAKARTYQVPLNGLNALGAGGANTAGTLSITGTKPKDGFVGGGQAGYNYQYGYFVYGLETDLQYAGFGRPKAGTASYTVTSNTGALTTGAKVGTVFPLQTSTASFVDEGTGTVDYYGTVRAKAGYLFNPATLAYLTGGFAYGGSGGRDVAGDSNTIRFGYAVGGGLEYLITPALSARVEGMYVSIAGNDANYACCVRSNTGAVNAIPVTGGHSADTDFAVARVGLNYRFSAY